jgi:pimeloyl-ACP methyl ester carboxylesterase
MNTFFASSPDGTRIAYERCGAGPVLVLLHGGGNSRQMWHEASYVERLQDKYTVIPWTCADMARAINLPNRRIT